MLANGRHDLHLSASRSKLKKDMPVFEPLPVERLNWLIHLQHIRGEINSCKELIKAEIEKNSGKNEYAFFKQGTILRQEGKVQDALDSFQICLKLNPDNVDNIKEVAKCLFEMRRFRLSLEAYLEAERIARSRDWQIYFYIGQCYLRLGETAKAKDYAEKAVQLGKQEVSYALLIKILILEGDFKTAVATSNAAVESCPDSVKMLTKSGLLYLKTGHMQNAFEQLSSALALDPTCSKALLGIGYITQRHEEFDVALTKYKIAVVYAPDSVALWNNIGICFYSKQKYVAAISCLKRALWISPLNWKVLFNLGLVHLATQQPTSAFNFVCAAVNLRPDIADSFAVLGCALLELKDAENAVLAFRQALTLAPSNLLIMANAAACYQISGLGKEACELLQQYQNVLEKGAVAPQEILELWTNLSSLLEPASSEEAATLQERRERNKDEGGMTKKDIPIEDQNPGGFSGFVEPPGKEESTTPHELDDDEV
ncbi:unnamed protein product [Brassicogethes aeneus]|uniref:Bardet-Biedl syndrome 4 n=1 Tax=Brassicogethes aeneus TaxID=1431903 RepID=A0A9P0AZS7_BRAAE|nr:unnamed protein product [Brassicogethes aeneus]